MKITLQLRFAFVCHCIAFLWRRKYVIYLFDVVTFFYDVRITSYLGVFEVFMEITLHLHLAFVCIVTLRQVLLRQKYFIYLFDLVKFFMMLELRNILLRRITYENKFTIIFLLLFVILTYFYYVKNTLLFVRCSYVFSWR